MDQADVTRAFAALAHPVRLAAVQLLAGQEAGWPAGRLAQELKVRQNTLSAHIAILQRANLVFGHRHGRFIVYQFNRHMAQSVLDHAARWMALMAPPTPTSRTAAITATPA